MKKLLILSLFLAVVMSACYDEYKSDFDYTTAYFANQYPVRTVIIDPAVDQVQVGVGATYGGKYSYSGNSETVDFVIADTMITNNSAYTDLGIKLMPESWYTLSNESQIEIKDNNLGFVYVNIIKDSLVSHNDAAATTYAIPFLITSASTDSILLEKNFTIVAVKFKNELDGRYYVKGVDKTLDVNGAVVDSLTESYSNPALVLNKYAFLSTVSKNSLSVPRIGVEEGETFMYNLEFSSNGNCTLSADDASAVTVLAGTAQYNADDKTFICNYTYTHDGNNHQVVDTMIYSNTEINNESWY